MGAKLRGEDYFQGHREEHDEPSDEIKCFSESRSCDLAVDSDSLRSLQVRNVAVRGRNACAGVSSLPQVLQRPKVGMGSVRQQRC